MPFCSVSLQFEAGVNGGNAQGEILVGDKSEAGPPDHGRKGFLLRELPATTTTGTNIKSTILQKKWEAGAVLMYRYRPVQCTVHGHPPNKVLSSDSMGAGTYKSSFCLLNRKKTNPDPNHWSWLLASNIERGGMPKNQNIFSQYCSQVKKTYGIL